MAATQANVYMYERSRRTATHGFIEPAGRLVGESLLYNTREVVIQVIFFSLMMLAIEFGFRLGRKLQDRTSDKIKPQISAIEGSLLAVLGLLLGFTMSMSVSRYEQRKQLGLEEANALGTACLRTQLVPDPQGKEILGLLQQYIKVRVDYGSTAGNDLPRINELRRQGAQLQSQFWGKTAAYAHQDPNPVKAGLLLQALNQAIDLEASRWMSRNDHVPGSVIYVIAVVAILSALLVGFAFGVYGRRQLLSMCALSLAITIVLAVIVDLDRPRSGFIRVTQQPMIDLMQQQQQQQP